MFININKLLILLFSILIPFHSYGEWVKVTENNHASIYIDYDTIKEHGGYVYWWELHNYYKPKKDGFISGKLYAQGDCVVNKYKPLSITSYKQPMGKGIGKKEFELIKAIEEFELMEGIEDISTKGFITHSGIFRSLLDTACKYVD